MFSVADTVEWPLDERQELLPCPMCGGYAKTLQARQDVGGGDSRLWVAIECDRHPGMMIRATAFGPHGYRQPGDLESDVEARRVARGTWNSREP